jgi:hypothetical protein
MYRVHVSTTLAISSTCHVYVSIFARRLDNDMWSLVYISGSVSTALAISPTCHIRVSIFAHVNYTMACETYVARGPYALSVSNRATSTIILQRYH